MTIPMDASNFPMPNEFQEKLKQLEKRVRLLEDKNTTTHTMTTFSSYSNKSKDQ